jgi:hypothetical protein
MYVNTKTTPAEAVLESGAGGNEGERWWRGELKYDIFDIL